ncbi:NADPH-dependent oxidoreductase [Oxobacter pfennigii]|uniref:NADPH-dependent oxidoreductase n=1 Tax=Oxobacter pfennigii TaxID=36849 RepID=A0A0N8NTS8_9CLOT|nr:nitroreductase family protein [Oxobacter pfennigii]KPU45672.1 NADPH-dependent oxidoreductase [Oxobacter pfennigii]
MEFLDLAKKRYSVRKYQNKKVEEEKLLKILEAGRIAPTAANAQPQRLIVVREEKGLEKLHKCARLYGAPLAVIVCANHDSSWKRPYDKKDTSDIDASIVTDHMMLEATELGLGTVWICYFAPEVLREEFNLPDNIEPVNILAIGYAEGEDALPDRHDTMRKPIKDTVVYETF